MEVVIGVDVGTTSAKAVAFGVDGVARAIGRAGYALQRPQPGWAEQDPVAVADAAVAALRECVAATTDRIAGVAFGAAMHGLTGLGADGRALTPLITWADRRAAPLADALGGTAEGLALHRRTGTPIHPMSPLLKLAWLREQQPELFARVTHWVGVKELVLARLTGELVVDHGCASATGLLDLASRTWDEGALAYAGITAEQLARLVPVSERVSLTAEAAHTTGLDPGTPLVAGGADGPSANVGLGATEPGTAACSIGTSAALRVVTDAPRVDDDGRLFCFVLDDARYVVGGATNNGGNVLDWAAAALAPDLDGDHAALLEIAERAPAGSEGLLFLPYLHGERAPRWETGARGAFVGLTSEHRREHLVRAAVEGVGLQLALVLDAMGPAGVELRQIRATGGFSRSRLWRGILASTFGRPIGFAASPEGSALGAAIVGMRALGLEPAQTRPEVTVEPTAADTAVYARTRRAFAQAADALALL